MSALDWMILLFLAGLAAGAVRYIKKNGMCTGSCAGCAHSESCKKKKMSKSVNPYR